MIMFIFLSILTYSIILFYWIYIKFFWRPNIRVVIEPIQEVLKVVRDTTK